MKRAITLISSLMLGFGCLATPLSALPTVSPSCDVIEASAATEDPYAGYEISNGYYQFDTGAAVHNVANQGVGMEQAFVDLRFTFEVPHTSHFNFDHEEDYANYTFTVVRDGGEYGKVPVYEVKLYTAKNSIAIAHKQLAPENVSVSDVSLRDNSVTLSPKQTTDGSNFFEFKEDGVYFTGTVDGATVEDELWEENVASFQKLYQDVYDLEGYTIDSIISNPTSAPFKTVLYPDEGMQYETLYLKMNVNSIYTEYFVVCDVDFHDYEGTHTEGFLWNKKEVKDYNTELLNMATIRSETRSCYQVLKNIEAAGALEYEFTDETTLAIVNDILGNTVEKTVTVKYLKQLGDSPFAQAVEEQATVSTYNDTIYYDNVCTALGVKSLNCMGSTISHFEKNSYNVYEAVYLSSVKMKALTEDGNFKDYYLDLGQTFNEFVDEVSGETSGKDVFDPGLFSYMLNEIHKLYPITEGYSGDQLYAFWGFMVIPETYTTNTIWATFFSIDPTITGIPRSYEAMGNMTIGEYWESTGEYEMTWAQKIWQIVAVGVQNWGELKAKFVIYYTNPDVSEASFDESGSDDADGTSSGAIIESVKDVLSGIGETINDYKEEKEADATRTIMIICGVLSGFVLVGGAAYIYASRKNK